LAWVAQALFVGVAWRPWCFLLLALAIDDVVDFDDVDFADDDVDFADDDVDFAHDDVDFADEGAVVDIFATAADAIGDPVTEVVV
jgi:hypothetical protein